MVFREFYIIYNGKTDEDLGLYVVRRPSIPAPELSYEPIIIPGRDGFLMPKNTHYEAIEIRVELNFLCAPEQYGETIRKAKKWLSGTGELIMSDDQSVFYKVLNVQVTNLTRKSRELCTFDAVFTCDPYTYFTAGKKEVSVEEAEYNAWDVCHPIYHLHITSTAGWSLTVNGERFTGNHRAGDYMIDSDRQIIKRLDATEYFHYIKVDAYSGLWLLEGKNTITSNNVEALTITPNWRAL